MSDRIEPLFSSIDDVLSFAKGYSVDGHSATRFGLQESDEMCEAMCVLAAEVERLRTVGTDWQQFARDWLSDDPNVLRRRLPPEWLVETDAE